MKLHDTIAMEESRKAIEEGGLALFTCPRREGNLRLTPKTCAQQYTMRQPADPDSEEWLRLQECYKCPVGAANAEVFPDTRRKRVHGDDVVKALLSAPGATSHRVAMILGMSQPRVHAALVRLKAQRRVTSAAHGRSLTQRWWVA